MNKLFIQVVSGAPRQMYDSIPASSPEYTILCAQAPDPEDRIALLMRRFTTSTEGSSAQTMCYLLQTCASANVSPDEAEHIVETLVEFADHHPSWTETIKWICALIHYYCTDDVTVSIFSECGAPSVAVRALKENVQNDQLVLAACALLSHFNLYPIGDGISQLARALQAHHADALVCKVACRALAEFTSYVLECPSSFVPSNKEFVEANGVEVLESVLRDQIGDEETTRYVARIAANVTSSGIPNSLEADSKVISYLAEAMGRYADSDLLCSHALHVFSNFPNSSYIEWDTVAKIFKTTESEATTLEAIHFFCSVAMNVKTQKQLIYSTGCLQRVLEVMRKHESNGAIQANACSLLSYLSFDSETITSEITESCGILLVLKAMQNFPDNEDLLVSACAALSGLTFNNFQGQQVIIQENGVARILDAMRFGKSARLQENGCLAIGTMCWNSELKADVVRLNGVELIMKALEEHYTSPGLVKNVCRALAQVAFNCEAYRDAMCASGAIPLIIKGMAQHPDYDRVQMHSCVALSYLSWNNEENSAKIAQNKGYGVIINAMRNHLHNYEVQEHAARAIANIGTVPCEDLEQAPEQIVAAMRRHEHVSEVQEETCRAIVTLSLISPAYKDKLCELNVVEFVVAAMRNFAGDQVVQQEACNALAHLAYEHAKLNKAVTELNGVEVLLTAMKTYVNAPKVQLNACGGLSALAFDNTLAQQQIYDLGGVACVIRAMTNFERLRMLELGCSVLGTLAWNTEIKERVAVVAIPEILKAMRVHYQSPLLQKSTCRAISQFAFNSESNRRLLADSGAIPLIVTAMRSHITMDKLLVHGIKALTYLCWENTQVAEAIINEGIEEVLQKIVNTYSSSQRVYGEAVHLSKILFRKVSSSPQARMCSPPFFSPVSMSQTPGPGVTQAEKAMFLSPPTQMDMNVPQFHALPQELSRQEGRLQRTQWGNQEHQARSESKGEGPSRRRRNRRRGGNNSFERRPGQLETHGEEQSTGPHHMDPYAARAQQRDNGASNPLSVEDLWDDPDPGTYHGNRQLGNLNWQRVELARQHSEGQRLPSELPARGGGRSNRRRGNPRNSGRGRGRSDQ
ncbi:hypothetical protein TraAM80_00085 [Trypanosoma rangeli]|uniref:LRRK2 ARM repeat domain-containing protein n=1 Tax=Trypanosoma rangeli TaxID=5698 RepID=A0A422P4T6_TRYRA|nr:uncharacterized protein TraAM80_00085 [Trypanosoma rangeli]RNF12733.1 hypothetical protein TraAM80_00085 [Trypanosoma rangeli]|eukprot:RNF12733.1 hypothetical protein TraAM80_00085 [Trypanosoma rangeli]